MILTKRNFKMYKTQSQALEHVRQGENFTNKVFDKFRDDKRVVLEAISIKGFYLNGASERLKNDKEVVLKAVKKYGYALQFASEQLKQDKEVVLCALKENPKSIDFAHKNIREEIGDLDPIQYLESFLLKLELTKSLTNDNLLNKLKKI